MRGLDVVMTLSRVYVELCVGEKIARLKNAL